jgi:N-hydroxyarylamine O-acetyltransferase
VLIVIISGKKWLADVGFGGPGLRSPLPIIFDRVQEQYGDRYRLRRDPELGTVLQKEAQDIFLDLYAFDESEKMLEADLEMANHFTSTWPASTFRLHRMCSLPYPWGRVTLSDMELNIHRDGQSVQRALPSGPEYIAALAEHFGIHIDAKYEEFLPLMEMH